MQQHFEVKAINFTVMRANYNSKFAIATQNSVHLGGMFDISLFYSPSHTTKARTKANGNLS